MKFAAYILAFFLLLAGTTAQAQEITKKRGKYKFYFPSGKVSASGKVKNYHRNGKWTYFDEEGNVVSIANFVMDTINGLYSEFYSTGKLFVTGTYCMNKKCGNWKTYGNNGEMISDENFVDAHAHGIQRYWYPNGKMRDSVVMSHDRIEYRKAWYSNGSVKTVETYVDGLPHGRWVVYPEVRVDTFALTVDDYRDGKRHGWHYQWSGASLVEAYHYFDGLPDGTFTRYELNGQPLVMHQYRLGKLNGKTTYFKDGVTIKTENYVDDVKEGVEIEYNRHVKPSKRTWYDGGEVDSSHIYHPNGKLAIFRLYGGTNGMSNYKEWDSSGVLLMKGMMHNDLRDGEWTTYYPNGKIRSTTNYVDGKIVGLYTKYYPNGKKMIQYTFLPTGTNTMPDVWNEKGRMLKMGTKEYDEMVEGNRPGEIFSDPSEFNRNIIEHRIHESASTEVNDAELLYKMEVDEALNLVEQDAMKNSSDSGQVYSFCEIMPEFPGGMDSLYSFIRKNMVYPHEAHEKYGVVYVNYIVEKDGRVTNVKVLKGVPGAPELSSEAVRVISSFPPQKAGTVNGKPVRCSFTLPIRFEPAK